MLEVGVVGGGVGVIKGSFQKLKKGLGKDRSCS